MKPALWGLAGLCVVALAFVGGYAFNQNMGARPEPQEREQKKGDDKTGEDRKEEEGKKKYPVGQTVECGPPAPAVRPPAVDPNWVQQVLKPGKTYKTLLKGSITSRGSDLDYFVRVVVNIHYAYEAAIDREIVENDGETVVEKRYFRHVQSLKVVTELDDVKIELGAARIPILAALYAYFPPAAEGIRMLDGLSLKPAVGVLKTLGLDPLKLTGQDQKMIKVLTQFDDLKGKAVKLIYSNKPGGSGVVRFQPIAGAVTENEDILHRHSAVLSDALLFPEQTRRPGESWTVRGNAFGNYIDPGLRAAVGGEVTVMRGGDTDFEKRPVTELLVKSGRLELLSENVGEGRVGWFEPQGKCLFARDDRYVVQGELTGKGLVERVSRGLLLKSEMRQEGQIKVQYSCQMVDTPKEDGK